MLVTCFASNPDIPFISETPEMLLQIEADVNGLLRQRTGRDHMLFPGFTFVVTIRFCICVSSKRLYMMKILFFYFTMYLNWDFFNFERTPCFSSTVIVSLSVIIGIDLVSANV